MRHLLECEEGNTFTSSDEEKGLSNPTHSLIINQLSYLFRWAKKDGQRKEVIIGHPENHFHPLVTSLPFFLKSPLSFHPHQVVQEEQASNNTIHPPIQSKNLLVLSHLKTESPFESKEEHCFYYTYSSKRRKIRWRWCPVNTKEVSKTTVI
jgi:hypothetical protein